MARPWLADPNFMRKAAQGQADRINTCIACNQACLDHVFQQKEATCLVNPRACRETLFPESVDVELSNNLMNEVERVAVIGAGPAGLSAATELAAQGHEVHLFEASGEIGGQFNMAKRIPGKEEFHETLRYFGRMLELSGVHLHLNTRVDAQFLLAQKFEKVVVATGVSPRIPQFPGLDHPKVLSYLDVLLHNRPVGARVAIVGAGGIGFDTATFLTDANARIEHQSLEGAVSIDHYRHEWGIDAAYQQRGGLTKPETEVSPRQVWLLQRSKGKVGDWLGKTTGWAHRMTLKKRGVQMWADVQYVRVDDAGCTF